MPWSPTATPSPLPPDCTSILSCACIPDNISAAELPEELLLVFDCVLLEDVVPELLLDEPEDVVLLELEVVVLTLLSER